MVETYSSMGIVMALYIARIVSLCFPHVVDVSVLRICIVLRAFVVVIYMCLLYICCSSCGSGACCFVWIEIVCLCPVGMMGCLFLLCLYRCVLMLW